MKRQMLKCALIGLLPLLMACTTDAPTPLPMGYFRIDLPEPNYHTKTLDCPFTFEHAEQSRFEFYASGKQGEQCWFDLYYPKHKARIHFTYKALENNLRAYIEESRTMAYEHSVKASRIKSDVISIPEKSVFGLVYDLDGNVASPFQFYLTDSTSHFIRGSMYFESKPNRDSLYPVMNHIKEDMQHLISTFAWK